MSTIDDRTLKQHRAFTQEAAFGPLGPRTQIEVTGADRIKFLQNYCTADINRLAPFSGTEAFITDVKGKVLGHVFIYCGEESLAIETAPGGAETLLPHLERYTLADDVQLQDVSEGWKFFHIGGPKAAEILQTLTGDEPPQTYLDFLIGHIGDAQVALGRGGAIDPRGFTLCCSSEQAEAVAASLAEAGMQPCEADVLQILRVEAGVPAYGIDITDANLPQEANRNEQAISFTKGCYLGQETVARLDALGHVNKLLVGVKFVGPAVPEAGAELKAADKPVGKVTSAVFSPRLDAPLALAYVRTQHSEPGARLSSEVGEAEVVALPVAK